MNKDQAEAKKRSILKRYLILRNIDVDTNSDTKVLQALVIGLHKQTSKKQRLYFAWPLSKPNFIQQMRNVPYLTQLLAIKQCFGLKASTGCILDNGQTVFCSSVQDFIKIGWVKPKYAYLDHYMDLIYEI